jgi:hypothetical protein
MYLFIICLSYLVFITVFMDVAPVMHHILLICIAYLTQIHLALDIVVDLADPLLIGLPDPDPSS